MRSNLLFHPIRVVESDGKLENAIGRAQDLLAANLNDVLNRLHVIWDHPPSAHEGIEGQGCSKSMWPFAGLRSSGARLGASGS
jgi:hypothetical protein